MIYTQYLNSRHNQPIDLNQILTPYPFLTEKKLKQDCFLIMVQTVWIFFIE
jgi:hypothetical protein